FTGLLSFGHALYVAVGVYMANIAITEWHWSFGEGVLFTALLGFLVPLVLGTVSLRVGGIAFAMVTLAFAQAGSVLVHKDPRHWTHGEEGLGTDYHKLPAAFVGIFNTKNLYWLALGYLVVVFFVVRWAVESSPARVRAGAPSWAGSSTRTSTTASAQSATRRRFTDCLAFSTPRYRNRCSCSARSSS